MLGEEIRKPWPTQEKWESDENQDIENENQDFDYENEKNDFDHVSDSASSFYDTKINKKISILNTRSNEHWKKETSRTRGHQGNDQRAKKPKP